MIKAIETTYKGYRFRSRLEARWAVFFDALGIKYRYEHEGVILNNGSRYLPDFYLVPDELWAEIKPQQCDLARAAEKMRHLVHQSGCPGVIISGDPWPGEYEVILFRPFDLQFSSSVSGNFTACEHCHALFVHNWSLGDLIFTASGDTCQCSSDPCETTPWLKNAFAAARGAHFEFGAQGR